LAFRLVPQAPGGAMGTGGKSESTATTGPFDEDEAEAENSTGAGADRFATGTLDELFAAEGAFLVGGKGRPDRNIDKQTQKQHETMDELHRWLQIYCKYSKETGAPTNIQITS
jgi:hypothetical protein